MNKQNQAAAVSGQFQIEGEFASVAPYGNGHINDRWCAVFHQTGVPVRYILQRTNTAIFQDAPALMQNIQRVTAHLAAKLSDEPDSARRVLKLIPASDGSA